MPQIFQVLKCYKCSVFQLQVHQKKKSNMFECKLCGEKQSIKRHYGLGTGKECRLHVQKLNGIRSELDYSNEGIENETDEELEIKHEHTHTQKQSKWSNFIEKTDDVDKQDGNDGMYLGSTKVVLEIPKKKRKFSYPSKIQVTDNLNKNKVGNMIKECQESHIVIGDEVFHRNTSDKLKLQIPNSYVIPHSQLLMISKNTKPKEYKKQEHSLSTNNSQPKSYEYIPPKVNQSSKWAQYTDEDENASTESGNGTLQENNNISNKLFSLCDDKDLDNVLSF